MQDASIEIGSFDPAEADDLGMIFHDAVHRGTVGFYDADQRRAWVSKIPSGPDWAARLGAARTLVARDAGRPVGFMTLATDGYIDLAFVDPGDQRRGIGTRLYSEVEELARMQGMARLYSEASHLVRGLFERQGWTVLQEQKIDRAGVTLTNFVMEKRLGGVTQA